MLALALTVAASIYSRSAKQESLAPITAPKMPAFLGADWGMSPSQVETANRVKLEPGAEGMEARGQRFLGRESTVRYGFKEGRLSTVHVFISDFDETALDKDVSGYLERLYGGSFSEIDDGTPLKRIWQFKDKIVNYWFYEDDTAVHRPYKAVYGVVSLPITQPEAS